MQNEHSAGAWVAAIIICVLAVVLGVANGFKPDGKRGCRTHYDTTVDGRSCANLKTKSGW